MPFCLRSILMTEFLLRARGTKHQADVMGYATEMIPDDVESSANQRFAPIYSLVLSQARTADELMQCRGFLAASNSAA